MTDTGEALALERPRFYGVGQIVRFNWPLYAAGATTCAAGGAALWLINWPAWLLVPGWIAIGILVWWQVASLTVSYLVYDVSPLYRWRWLPGLLRSTPGRWANIHAGLDESSLALRHMFGGETTTVDIYDASEMTEPAIARARQLTTPPVTTVPADYRMLPFADGELDAVFLLFAAHEIRSSASRLLFWREISRVLGESGSVILVEHQRDVMNFLAFGPGCWHFLPRREWLHLFGASGLAVDREFNMTPFVRVFVLGWSTSR